MVGSEDGRSGPGGRSTVLRACWLGLAVLGVAAGVFVAAMPVGSVSLGCAKGDSLSGPLAHADATCDDSIRYALGLSPPVQVAMVLAIPAVVAALVLRTWVAALVAGCYAVIAVFGLMNWTDWRITFLVAGVVGTILAGTTALVQFALLRSSR
ncbi:ABC transporter permease [Gordonia sp. (in: high G+C Gram-positive bacteria)]|uniref:ABC transporter permease n=1 Tax=Gordonia sp. (in: high G+C Gram-positive bacteria) TaxID=84139 RepID=UPI00261F7DA8|nr:ABC transporter permease [Gordonia sp. (in: high G+C Gram-positive bacteria)]